MGTSTDAILFWGIAYKEDELLEDDVDLYDRWEERYCATQGLPDPGEISDEEYAKPGVRERHLEYLSKKEALLRELAVELDTHCSAEYPIPFVAIKEATVVTKRGYISEIGSLDVDPSWEPKLRAFCEVMGLPWKEPGWRQVAWWG